MLRSRAASLVVLGCWLAAGGCTTLREIPPSRYVTRAANRPVRVQTNEGLVYEFDYAEFNGDTLTGYRTRSDLEGTIDQVTQVRIPFEELQVVSVRQIDWRRTSLVGGGVLAVALAVGLKASQRQDTNDTGTSGGGKIFNP